MKGIVYHPRSWYPNKCIMDPVCCNWKPSLTTELLSADLQAVGQTETADGGQTDGWKGRWICGLVGRITLEWLGAILKNRYLQRYMCLLRYFDRNYMMHTRASLMYNEMDIFWARTEYHFEYCIWRQMLTEMFAFWFITQSLLKTKQMAKSTLKVKINSKSWEAIKMIGPWTYLHKYKM